MKSLVIHQAAQAQLNSYGISRPLMTWCPDLGGMIVHRVAIAYRHGNNRSNFIDGGSNFGVATADRHGNSRSNFI